MATTERAMGNYISSALLAERLSYTRLNELVNIFHAEATATLATTTVSAVAVTGKGGGYTSTPTVVFTGGGGANAAATATMENGRVTAVTVTAGGTGYTSAPAVSFTGGGVDSTAKDAAIASVIERAEGEVDSMLSVAYETPVPSNAMVEGIALSLAIAELYMRSDFPDMPDKVKDSIKRAQELLDKLSTGKARLPVSGGVSSDSSGGLIFDSEDSNYSNMIGF